MKNEDLNFSKEQINERLDFDNGCTIYLEDDMWIGVTPYGVDNIFNLGDMDRVREWLVFWSEDRDENGTLCDNADNDFYSNCTFVPTDENLHTKF